MLEEGLKHHHGRCAETGKKSPHVGGLFFPTNDHDQLFRKKAVGNNLKMMISAALAEAVE
jgi:hypothetical protein